MSVLDKIAACAKERVERAKRRVPLAEIRRQSSSLPRGDFPFERALGRPGLSFICECKRASPSAGLIAPEYPYLDIAIEYEAAGADAISVLTEPRWFLGDAAHLREVAAAVRIPCLRKDFVVDEYMIYEAKVLGAQAALLICALEDEGRLRDHLAVCSELGLSVLVEAHDEGEVDMALRAGARIVGVNNRSLGDFSVDIGNSRRLRGLVPPGVLFVAESGVRSAKDVEALRGIGADAVLVGGALMGAGDRKARLAELRGEA